MGWEFLAGDLLRNLQAPLELRWRGREQFGPEIRGRELIEGEIAADYWEGFGIFRDAVRISAVIQSASMRLILAFGLMLLWCGSAWGDITTFRLPTPFIYGATASTRALPPSQGFDMDFVFTAYGGSPNEGGGAGFGWDFTLTADCQDNGSVIATVNGTRVFYFDSCRQPPQVLRDTIDFKFGVPQVVHVNLAAGVSKGPNSHTPGDLSASIFIANIMVEPTIAYKGLVTGVSFAPVPEPSTLALFFGTALLTVAVRMLRARPLLNRIRLACWGLAYLG